DDESLEKAVANVEGLGFKVKLSKNIKAKKGFIAGSDQQRIDDLNWAFSDKNIKAVWCARGGYGCSRLLPKIDYKNIKNNPKIFIGFSDVTALVNAFYQKTGLITFHGPVAASNFTDFTKEQLMAVLVEGQEPHEINLPQIENQSIEPFSFTSKKTKGELAGGNLSLLAAMAGTDYAVDFKNKIAFIEDIGEKPYRIDRMLTQLRQACQLDKACGIALGDFSGCDSKDENSLTLNETLTDRLQFKGMPVGYRFPFGHTNDHCTLPIGVKVELDVENKRIKLLESAVV
ncbi:MAG: LD-carboxypeptidase, partial [Bacteroidota bacterium]